MTRYRWATGMVLFVGLVPQGCGDDGPSGGSPSREIDCSSYADGPTVGPGEPGPTGFPVSVCNPSSDRSGGGSYYRCCSDDPLAAGANNGISQTGKCVHVDDVPAGSGLPPLNCPVACDPSADAGATAQTCGGGRVCCQTQELQPEDCVQDEDGRWRPKTPDEAGSSVPTSRGFCLALSAGQVCPTATDTYRDACELINDGAIDPPGSDDATD